MLAGLIAAIALVAIVMFGGSDAYTVTARFQNAGQLVKGNQVEVGGRPVGSVKSIGLADDGMAEVKFQVDGDRVNRRTGQHAERAAHEADRHADGGDRAAGAAAQPRAGIERLTVGELDQAAAAHRHAAEG